MLGLKRLFPFTTFSGAAWFALRHRRPIIDWGNWAVQSVPRVAGGGHGDVFTEARLRLRLAGDERLAGDRIQVAVVSGEARVSGEVAPGNRKVVAGLVEDAPGVERMQDDLRERGKGRRRRA